MSETLAADDTVKLGAEAAEVARAEAQAVLAMVVDPQRRGALADLLAAVEEGHVGGRDADALAELLELGLQSGRIRALYGPDGERSTLALYRRLPAGRELVESAASLTAALESIAGRTIERLAVSAVGPGEYGVTITTDEVELVLRLGRAGARLATIGA
jgi:GT2 family glycosyltransferase